MVRRKFSLHGVAIAAVLALAASGAHAKKKDEPLAPRPSDILREAPEDAWRPVDLDNLLLMDLPSGEVVIELRPDFAPLHVERIKLLTRQGFYNGLNFHRVIEGFVAQGGDPNGDGTGGSTEQDLAPEFARDTGTVEGFVEIGRDRVAGRVGFIHGLPAAAEPEPLRTFLSARAVSVWGAHCPGVMSMARAARPDSANSQFFLMIGDARQSLDRRYSVWGMVVDGFENTRRIERGEPPRRPTPIVRMRLAADVPPEERPKVEVLRTDHDVFSRYIDAAGFVSEDGLVRDLCNIRAPVRVNGKIK